MEAFDVAHKAFEQFVKVHVPTVWHTLKTEADVRMKLVDPIFTKILGWPSHCITLEGSDDDGRCDYCLKINEVPRLMVEAKAVTRDLGINSGHAARYLLLQGGTFKESAAIRAIDQLNLYCKNTGTDLACATNGNQWFVFRTRKGKNSERGMACCFGSLQNVLRGFSVFYDLLSYEGVNDNRYQPEFLQAEKDPVRAIRFNKQVRPFESRNHLVVNNAIYRDIDKIMRKYFQDITGDDDEEVRKRCFVVTPESDLAEQNLVRISDELRAKIQKLNTNDGRELALAIRRVKEDNRREFVLLVGAKGAGKTTFVTRFFKDVLPPEIASDCTLIRVDLAPCTGDPASVHPWLQAELLKSAEKAAFGKKTPPFPDADDLQGMFWQEYERQRTGPFEVLYRTDKPAFKIRFGEWCERLRVNDPLAYTLGILHMLAANWKRVPCIVFDNAEHFDVKFQEAVYRYATAVYASSICLVVVPITDTTSWQLTDEGAVRSFYNEAFFLPTPPLDLIVEKRLDLVQERLNNASPVASKGQLAPGVPLEVSDVTKLAASLQAVLLGDPIVLHWVSQLANLANLRRSLEVIRALATSPHIPIPQFLASSVSHDPLAVPHENVKLALVRRQYDIYWDGDSAPVHNLFQLGPLHHTTPLLAVRVLALFKDAWESDPVNHSRYLSSDEVVEFFEPVQILPAAIEGALGWLWSKGLIRTKDPLVEKLTGNTQLQQSASGAQHLEWATADFIYLESMAMTTPLLMEQVYSDLKELFTIGDPRSLRQAVIRFVNYVKSEDAAYVSVPKHNLYLSQTNILKSYSDRLNVLLCAHQGNAGNRYVGECGRIVMLDSARGFGFIQPSSGSSQLYFKLAEVVNAPAGKDVLHHFAEFNRVTVQDGREAAQSLYVFEK